MVVSVGMCEDSWCFLFVLVWVGEDILRGCSCGICIWGLAVLFEVIEEICCGIVSCGWLGCLVR